MSFRYTSHGEERANQRGFRRQDIELIRRCGTPVADRKAEVYVLRNKDVEQEISAEKRNQPYQGAKQEVPEDVLRKLLDVEENNT